MEMYYLLPAERGCVLLLVVSTTSPHPYSYLEREATGSTLTWRERGCVSVSSIYNIYYILTLT